MRVLFACSDLLGHAVFAERHLDALVRHAPTVEASLLTPGAAYSRDGLARWMLRTWGTHRFGPVSWRHRVETIHSWTLARAITRRLREFPYDVLHVHTQSLAFSLPRLSRLAPCVVSLDATSALLARLQPALAATYRAGADVEARVMPLAKAVVAWSEWAAESVRTDWHIRPSDVSVIAPPVPVRAHARQPGTTEGPMKCLFVGNDFIRKGGDVLLDAYHRLPKGLVQLDVVTNDRSLGTTPAGVRVHRGLRHDDDRLVSLRAQADCLALPSREECYGIAVTEAMGDGLPVISTRVMALPGMVREGVDGLLVEPGDGPELAGALLQLAQDPELRCSMGRAAWERACAHFSPRVTAAAWEVVYREAFARG